MGDTVPPRFPAQVVDAFWQLWGAGAIPAKPRRAAQKNL